MIRLFTAADFTLIATFDCATILRVIGAKVFAAMQAQAAHDAAIVTRLEQWVCA